MAPRDGALTSQFGRYTGGRRRWIWDKSGVAWLEDKRKIDGAAGLWRVHDELYDLSEFAERHPGGRFWLDITRGQDITELFEASHCLATGRPEQQLARCRVRAATQPRNAPYTFQADGFYRTLKRRAAPVLRRVGTGAGAATRLVADGGLLLFLVTGVASAVLHSRLAAAASGVVLALLLGVGHNFLHQRDNWRMYLLDVPLLSSAEFRVSHALSHHMFPNTAMDLEVTLLEPVIFFLTHAKRRRGLADAVVYHFTLLISFFIEGMKRALRWIRGEQRPRPENALPLLHVLLLAGCAGLWGRAHGRPADALLDALGLWTLTVATCGYVFATLGLAAAHHHPRLYHDGDEPVAERDWGLRQLDAVGDRAAVRGSPLLVLTTFGDHGLHHLFPTVDHGQLVHLRGVFDATCAEFGVRYRHFSAWELLRGQHQQMGRTRPRPSDLMAAPTPDDSGSARQETGERAPHRPPATVATLQANSNQSSCISQS
ncbi:Cytochrome b5-related protein [Amphibalanus amphitrite]|uniref:Cytochrome b5-related protein n=1 Tax=Amphibalanus amphitrite TaxID=1232801 RepID=A0A6A4WPH7_AMPAM|nr:Cytochrome b5-related protein [Amphibalanus amphitrite]